MQKLVKIYVTCPTEFTNELIEIMSNAGAGNVGNYTHCSFVTKGVGSSKPKQGSRQFYGEVDRLNTETEDKIEMVCEQKDLEKVISAIKASHPYETPTIDVVQIDLYT